jgi:hypothetical protein
VQELVEVRRATFPAREVRQLEEETGMSRLAWFWPRREVLLGHDGAHSMLRQFVATASSGEGAAVIVVRRLSQTLAEARRTLSE